MVSWHKDTGKLVVSVLVPRQRSEGRVWDGMQVWEYIPPPLHTPDIINLPVLGRGGGGQNTLSWIEYEIEDGKD